MTWHNKNTPNRRKWRATRLKVLDRDGWACVKCGRGGRLEVDHIVPLVDSTDTKAMYALEGLQSLCRPCHFAKTASEWTARRPPRPEVEAWRALIADRSQGTLI